MDLILAVFWFLCRVLIGVVVFAFKAVGFALRVTFWAIASFLVFDKLLGGPDA